VFLNNGCRIIYSRFQINEVQILITKPDAKRLSTLFPVPCSLFPAVNDKYAQVERQIKVSDKEKRRLTVECDELFYKKE
jgi:hypothetical protein